MLKHNGLTGYDGSGKASEQVIFVLGAEVWVEVSHLKRKGKNILDRGNSTWGNSMMCSKYGKFNVAGT